ncbi:MAG: zinc-binding dehydrogenase [bacterium]|nr:zinc-binding dehydrogenase [bacterium]
MLALTHDRFGEPTDVIAPANVPVPEPQAGEVRLRLLRSPIHNHDLATIRGVYGYKPTLPAIAGSELVGAIDILGDGVQGLKPGMRVAAMTRGAWAEYVIVPAQAAVPMPEAVEDDRACQLLAMPLSALVLFDDLRTEPGMWIAQNAANGAVGRILMRIAQASGVNVINLVRRDDAADELRSYGAKHVVVTDRDGWQAQVRELTGGKGVARLVDSVAGPQSLDMQRLLAQHGELIVFGGLSGAAMKLDPSLMISAETVVRGFWMTSWMQRASHDERAATMKRIFELAMTNELPLPVSATYALGDAHDALRAAETPGRAGKVLLRV